MGNVKPGVSSENFECVVLDGSNILHLTPTTFSFERLSKAANAAETLGWKTNIILKPGTRDFALKKDSNLTANERVELKRWIDFGRINLAPSSNDKGIDDVLAIRYALTHNAWILTGDKFRDHLKELREKNELLTINEINKRRINVEFGPDNQPIFTPEIPRNMSSKINSKTVAETMEIRLDNRAGGINFQLEVGDKNFTVTLPLRETIGREFFYDAKGLSKETTLAHISKSHFRLDWDGKTVYVTDLGSTNGTMDRNQSQCIPNTPEPLAIGEFFSVAGIQMTRID